MPIITHVTPKHPDYKRLTAALTAEPLRSEWAADAESEHEDGVAYIVAYALDGNGVFVPAAWAGYRIETLDGGGRLLHGRANYVRRGFRDRTPELYATVYAVRHREVVVPLGLLGVAYLYDQPAPLHEADGWRPDTGDDAEGTSTGPTGERHHWRRFLWTP